MESLIVLSSAPFQFQIGFSLIMRPGDQLRELRNRLGVTTREVEEFSRTIAEDRQNEEFYISNAWLTQLENKNSVPSIYKLYSLSVIYRTKFNDLLGVFGIDLNATSRFQLALPLQNTHLTAFETPDSEKSITFPVRFDKSFNLETTSLISRMVEVWGEIPIALLQRLDVRHCQYGYVGIEDFTMYPLLRPGSFVQIDSHTSRMQQSEWRTELDRPIYFVELREGYACSWCEVKGSQLTLVPHPLSGCSIRQFAYPSEAEIIGRVTGVAMRLVPPDDEPTEAPKLPRRS
jgi:transcriptional regulator with XRE-family HTH domain